MHLSPLVLRKYAPIRWCVLTRGCILSPAHQYSCEPFLCLGVKSEKSDIDDNVMAIIYKKCVEPDTWWDRKHGVTPRCLSAQGSSIVGHYAKLELSCVAISSKLLPIGSHCSPDHLSIDWLWMQSKHVCIKRMCLINIGQLQEVCT